MKNSIHTWLLILVTILGVAIITGVKRAAAESAGTAPVIYPMPRSPQVEKKALPFFVIEFKEEKSAKQTGTDQDRILEKTAETGDDIFDGAGLAYEPASSLDPFMPLIQEKPVVPSAPPEPDKPQRILTPLEKMSLSQIKLVAVVQGENLNVAMVEEASGKGYEVRIGTYIGRNGGRVVDIESDRIVVREMVTDFKGVVNERFQELKLHKPDSGE